jgi:hypothetical protein
VLRRVLDGDENNAVLEFLHELRREDAELEVAPDRRNGHDDSRVPGLPDRRRQVPKVLRCASDGVDELGSAATPWIRPHLREDGEEDELGRGGGEDWDRLGEGLEAGGEDIVEGVLVGVCDPVRVILRGRFGKTGDKEKDEYETNRRNRVSSAVRLFRRPPQRSYSPSANRRRLVHLLVDRRQIGDCDCRKADVVVVLKLLVNEVPRLRRDGEMPRREERCAEHGGEDDEEEIVPATEERLAATVGGAEELAEVLRRHLEKEGVGDNGGATDDGGDGELEVEEDDGEEEGEDDGDGEGESLRDIVGVLDGDGCREGIVSE